MTHMAQSTKVKYHFRRIDEVKEALLDDTCVGEVDELIEILVIYLLFLYMFTFNIFLHFHIMER